MSQENVELVLALIGDPDVDLAQLVRDDTAWAAASQAATSVPYPEFEVAVELSSARSSDRHGRDPGARTWRRTVGLLRVAAPGPNEMVLVEAAGRWRRLAASAMASVRCSGRVRLRAARGLLGARSL